MPWSIFCIVTKLRCPYLFFIILHFHLQNWSSSGLIEKMKKLSERRKLEDLTIGPVLTVSGQLLAFLSHNVLLTSVLWCDFPIMYQLKSLLNQ